MLHISSQALASALNHSQVIDAIKQQFLQDYEMPDRHHHFYRAGQKQENTLLLMPAWNARYMGVKQVISAPGNARLSLPSIQGTYTLMDAQSGVPLAVMDARRLTAVRTACASALASRYLAREDAKTLLIIGGGQVALHLIPAHLAVRNYDQVWVWTRRAEAFQDFKEELGDVRVPVKQAMDLEAAVRQSDVISAATLSETPLIQGDWLQPGQHLDLIGSFKKHMREADDSAIVKSRLYVDTLYGALHESGELGIPLQKGLITADDVQGDLPGLCRGKDKGRGDAREITLFKSVGMAIEDLAAAILVYQKCQHG